MSSRGLLVLTAVIALAGLTTAAEIPANYAAYCYEYCYKMPEVPPAWGGVQGDACYNNCLKDDEEKKAYVDEWENGYMP